MLQKAERKAMEILSKYEKKCKDIEVTNQSSLTEKCFRGTIEILPKRPLFSFVCQRHLEIFFTIVSRVSLISKSKTENDDCS